MECIGFIGLGHMGYPMAVNLKKAGHRVFVYDKNQKAIAMCAKAGMQVSYSVVEAVKNSDVIFTMLQTGEQVKEVCLAKDGLFAHVKPNALYIDSSSIAISDSRELHEIARSQGLAMLDAPVSGGVAGAVNATLTIMVGGEQTHFEKAKPYLILLGKRVIYAGGAGNGQAAKICNNM